MINKQLKLSLILLCTFALLALLAPTVQAAESILPACVSEGYCTLCDVMELVINFGKFLLGIVGSLALLMFVYGGFTWLTSGGEPGKIDAGKKILINSVIGIAITFFAYIIVVFVVNALTASSGWKWDTKLTCTPLPGLEPPKVEDRGGSGGGETPGTKKLGETCAKTNECELTLYCDKETAKCAERLGNYPGVPNGKLICTGKEISGNDNLACKSTSCANWFAAAFLDGCYKNYCCATTLVTGGGECNDVAGETGKHCGNGLYCRPNLGDTHTGTCQPKLGTGNPCYSKDIIGAGADVDDICESDKCETSICTPSSGQGKEGDLCTEPWDCSNPCSYYPAEGTLLSGIPGVNVWANLAGSQIRVSCSTGQLFCWEWADQPNPDATTFGNDRGKCTKAPLADDKPCEDGTIIPYSDNPSAPCSSTSKCGTLSPTLGVDKCEPK